MQRYGTGTVERKLGEHKFILDGNTATIEAEIPDFNPHQYDQDIIYTNPSDLINSKTLISFSLIRFAKIKNFIDGVYAAAEERIAENNHKLSRPDFLRGLLNVTQSPLAKNYITAGLNLTHNEDPSVNIPQGFYDWSDSLREAFSQIKITSKEPGLILNIHDANKSEQIMASINRTLNQEQYAILKQQQKDINRFYALMTAKQESRNVLFPPAKLPDQELFMKLALETKSNLEEGLGKALVEAIKNGRVNFEITKDSGLYLRQMNEILPLILRNTSEFQKFIPNQLYKDTMEAEFISQWAGTRHTHVAHTDYSGRLITAQAGPISLYIHPELSVEPFSTSYEQMKNNLEFLEVIIQNFVPEILERKRWIREGIRSDDKIGEEFKNMQRLLIGLKQISNDSIHIPYENQDPAAIKYATTWLKNIKQDPDIDRNIAIFVPIIREDNGKRQIGYINAGYKTIDVTLQYKKLPIITPENNRHHPRIEFIARTHSLPVLVHREVRTAYDMTLLNDQRLRTSFDHMLGSRFSESALSEYITRLQK
ncbi:MAG: hypothetical protein ACP5N2_02380 [Candidatus Nanoarchaeia archaeon]